MPIDKAITPKRLSPCMSSVFTPNSMAQCRKVGPCKSPCNWFSPMAHRDHRIKNIMILFCFGGQSQWHTALEVFNPWFCLALIKNIVLCPRSPWHKRFQTPYMTEIHHSCCDYVSGAQTEWHTVVHHLWKMRRLDKVFIADLHGTPDFKIICWRNSPLVLQTCFCHQNPMAHCS